MYVLNNLFRRKTRALLAVSGIAVGIGAYVALVSISQGFSVTLNRLARFGAADIIVQSREVVDPILSVVPSDVLEQLRGDPRIREVDTYATQVLPQPDQPFFLLFGLADRGATMRSCRLVEGVAPDLAADEALLGQLAAQRLGSGIGAELRTATGTIRISGIFRTPNPLLAGSAITSHTTHKRLFPARPEAQLAFLHLAEEADEARLRTEIEERFPALVALDPGMFSEAYPQLELSHDLARAISWIACLAAAIGVLNTMMMNVMERTREIGTLLAIGWSRARVLRTILCEGILLASLGGLLGLGLGYLGAELAVREMQQALVTTRFSPALFLEGLGVAVILGGLGSLAPALRAARQSPGEALRYE